MFSKFFDNLGPLPHHIHHRDEHANRVGADGKPEMYFFPSQVNNHGGTFPFTFFGFNPDTKKEEVKKEVEVVAYDLLRLYARRKMQQGIQFLPDTNWQIEMEEAFEFVETPDQLKAIYDVKKDMEGPHPLDRLICGDVGFGKTEIARRLAKLVGAPFIKVEATKYTEVGYVGRDV